MVSSSKLPPPLAELSSPCQFLALNLPLCPSVCVCEREGGAYVCVCACVVCRQLAEGRCLLSSPPPPFLKAGSESSGSVDPVTVSQLSLHKVQVPDSVLSFVPRWKKKGRKEKTKRGREEKREEERSEEN